MSIYITLAFSMIGKESNYEEIGLLIHDLNISEIPWKYSNRQFKSGVSRIIILPSLGDCFFHPA